MHERAEERTIMAREEATHEILCDDDDDDVCSNSDHSDSNDYIIVSN